MFDKLHLLSQDAPEGGGGLRWRPHPYLRLAGEVPKGPAVFEWSARQREDLEALWRNPAADGARERLGKDLATFAGKLGWTPDAEMLEDAEQHGDEYLVTLSAVPPELYVLPWEVLQVGASGTYLSDYASAQVRYAVPGLEPREIQTAPPKPGVLFAWSGAGGAVPHDDQAAAIRAAAEAGGVVFHELAGVGEASLQVALDAGPPSVLHLLCHGLPGPEGEPPRLKWGASDSPLEITATQLARMLRRHHGAIRLVVLSACGSGDGHTDPLFMTSLAQELHKKGIPSVVASRYPLSVPGSRVMTRVLYDKMLREAWSLERALRHTREALFRVDDHGETHPGDAYGLQLYANDTERFTSDNNVEAERPVLASYPFGTAARPVPSSAPPPAELTLGLDADPGLPEDQLVAKLRHLSEDDSLTIAISSPDGKGTLSLTVRTTTDGAQRLLGVWRSKVLQVAVGVIVGELILTKGIKPAMAATSSAATGKTATATKVGRAIKETSQPFGGGGKLLVVPGQAAGSLAQVVAPVGQAAATAGKGALTASAVVGNTLAAKLAIAVVLAGAALVGGAAVYRVYTQPPTCGNGAIEAGEQCDDGNTGDGDGCSSKCLTEVKPRPGDGETSGVGAGGIAKGDGVDRGLVGGGGTSGVVAGGSGTGRGGTGATTTGATTSGGVSTGGVTTSGATTGTATTSGATTSGGRTGHGGTGAATTGVATTGGVAIGSEVATTSAGSGRAGTGSATTTSAGSDQAGTGTMGIGSAATASTGSGRATTATTGSGSTIAASTPTGTAPTGIVALGGTATGGTPTGSTATGSTATRGAVTHGATTSGVAAGGTTVDPAVLQQLAIPGRGRRISGETDIQPSDETQSLMIFEGVTGVSGTIALCVSPSGVVAEERMWKSTGYDDYDEKLLAAVHEWRYRPYLHDGTPVPVCSTVEFKYKLDASE